MVEGARLEIVCTFKKCTEGSNPSLSAILNTYMLWWLVSVPSQCFRCEPRQIRKEAAAAADVCAGVWLALTATLSHLLF